MSGTVSNNAIDATSTAPPQPRPHEGKTQILVHIEQQILEQLHTDALDSSTTAIYILRLKDYNPTYQHVEKDFTDLEVIHNQAVETVKETTNEITRLQGLLQQEQQRNNELHSINLALAARLSDAPTSRCQHMADLPYFNGDRGKLRNFKVQLRLKLAEEGSFRNEGEKIRYIIGLLEYNAMDQVGPHLKKNSQTLFATTEQVILCLGCAFDDPDPKGTARAQLEKLQMGNNNFSTYYAKFQCYCADLEYNDEAILNCLDYSLNNEMKDALVLIEKPTDLH